MNVDGKMMGLYLKLDCKTQDEILLLYTIHANCNRPLIKYEMKTRDIFTLVYFIYTYTYIILTKLNK